MKKIFLIIIIFYLCGCHQPMPSEFENKPPNIPEYIFPENDTTDVPIDITFRWSGGDPNTLDTVTYNFYLDKNPVPKLLASGLTVDSLHYDLLEYEIKYYWKIVAHDQTGDSTSSPVWTFTTCFANNAPPNKPYAPQPEDDATSIAIENAQLQWKGGDPNTFSVVTYDVLFGKSQDSLVKISENQPDTSYALGLLAYNTQYFWQIIASDNYGATTAGPVWDFTTKTPMLLFDDNFDSYSNQKRLDSIWSIMDSVTDIFITEEICWNDQGKSVCFVDSTDAGKSYLAKSMPAKDVGMIQFYWQVTTNNDFFGMRLYSQMPIEANQGPEVSIREGLMQYYNSELSWQTICQVEPNKWYFIQLLFDCTHQYYNIYVDNDLRIEQATWRGISLENLDRVYFLTFENRTCQKAYLDEVKYFSTP